MGAAGLEDVREVGWLRLGRCVFLANGLVVGLGHVLGIRLTKSLDAAANRRLRSPGATVGQSGAPGTGNLQTATVQPDTSRSRTPRLTVPGHPAVIRVTEMTPSCFFSQVQLIITMSPIPRAYGPRMRTGGRFGHGY